MLKYALLVILKIVRDAFFNLLQCKLHICQHMASSHVCGWYGKDWLAQAHSEPFHMKACCISHISLQLRLHMGPGFSQAHVILWNLKGRQSMKGRLGLCCFHQYPTEAAANCSIAGTDESSNSSLASMRLKGRGKDIHCIGTGYSWDNQVPDQHSAEQFLVSQLLGHDKDKLYQWASSTTHLSSWGCSLYISPPLL